MSYAVFAANKALSGGSLIAKLTYDNSILLTLFKQVAFDQNNKRGNFDFQNPLVFKLTDSEAGEIIRAVRKDDKMKFYHTFDDTKTTGQFNFYTVEAKGEYPARSGFGLSVSRNDVTIKIGFSLGEAERFAQWLIFSLNKVFEVSFQENLAKDREYLDKKKATETAKTSAPPAKKTKTTEKAPEKVVEKEPELEPVDF